jgi:putative addiction module component (TIGR02574 family)
MENVPVYSQQQSIRMAINTDELLALSSEEKLRIIALLWDSLEDDSEPIVVPDWAKEEAIRRRDEMRSDPSIGMSHEEVWRRC